MQISELLADVTWEDARSFISLNPMQLPDLDE